MRIEVVCNDWVGLEIMTKGYYELPSIELLRTLLRPGMVFFDIGAHVGQYTLFASPIVGNQGRVHCFEPDPDTFRRLSRNLQTNRIKNVCANQLALFSENGDRTFYRSLPVNIGGSSLSRPYEADSGRTVRVRCVRLDQYVEDRGLKRVDVIKMDTEGAEINVLRGAQRLLGSQSKPVLVLEFHERALQSFGGTCVQLAEFLRSRGYALFRAQLPLQQYALDPREALANVLALPPNRQELEPQCSAPEATRSRK